jgi:hypothetical protein
MSRIQQEPQQHIHDRLCSELNEMSIRIKLNSEEIYNEQTEGQKVFIRESRKRTPKPTDKELIELIERCRDEMNQCTKPFKLHR